MRQNGEDGVIISTFVHFNTFWLYLAVSNLKTFRNVKERFVILPPLKESQIFTGSEQME